MRTLSTPRAAGHVARTVLGLVLVVLGVLAAIAGPAPAGAQTTTGTAGPAGTLPPAAAPTNYVSVVTINGLIDPIVADLIDRAVTDAEANGARDLIFQADLDGSVVDDATLQGLLDRIARSSVPVYLWIGPTGAQLVGSATALVAVVDGVSMAPGTSVGDAPPGTPGLDDPRYAALRSGTLDAQQAKDAGIITIDAPTLGDLFIQLPNVDKKETVVNGVTRLEPVTQAVFSQLSLLNGFMHTAASPAVAYLLLSIGLALLIFELFTAGVGVAGVIGAGAVVLASYGLTVLPTRWWALAMIVVAMIAFAVDVQTGVPRFWSGAGMVLYVLGSLFLYDGVSMSWITIAVGIVGVALAFFAGMPSMVRTRFSTPTIGREWMIGEMGRAVTDINPDGVVQIKGAPWRAYTNRATPIESLDAVRVVGIEGLVLEVEPEEGAARDYRERRTTRGST